MNGQERKDDFEYGWLPVDYLVNYGLLFGSGTAEVDARGLNAFMTHKVSEQSEVVEAFEKIFGEAVTE